MTNASRLLLVLIAVLLGANDSRAQAPKTVPVLQGTLWRCLGNPALGYQYAASPAAACAAAFTGGSTTDDGWYTVTQTYTFLRCDAIQNAGGANPYAACFGNLHYYGVNRNGGSTTTDTPQSSQATGSLTQQCPPESSPTPGSSSTCTCNAGFSPTADGQRCTAACGPVNGVASSGYYDIGTSATASPKLSGCKGECHVFFDGTSPAGSSMEGGVKHWYAKGSYHYSGEKCTAGSQESKQVSESKPAVPADTCAPGQGTATMNGKTVCVDQDTDTPTPESEEKATTKTEKTTTTNPDGSTTTTETTTKTDGKGGKEVTVIRTTTRPDGSVTVDSETTGSIKPPGSSTDPDDGDDEPKGECEKNPSAAGCGGDPATVGDLYTPKDKTLSGVLGAARDTFMSSPVGSAVGGFFVVSGGGSCPTWTKHIPFLETDLTIDQFCSSFATTALALFKTALLLVASFFAFRIAVE